MRSLEERQVPSTVEENMEIQVTRSIPVEFEGPQMELKEKSHLLSAAQSKNKMYQAYNLELNS